MLHKRNKIKRKIITPNSGVVIGLTGGIGSGKSYALSCFKKLGFKVFDTDKCVHDLMKKGNLGYEKLSKIFPEAAGKNSISRKKLANIVLGNKTNLSKLEKIIHPLVRKAQQEFVRDNKGLSIVFEVPLLLENKREEYYDYVIATISDIDTRKKRVMSRKGMTEMKFDAILAKQVSDRIRRGKSDFIIDTNSTKQKTYKQIKGLTSNV